MTKTTTTKLRSRLGAICDKVVATQKPVRIRRRQGGDVVLMSAKEYDSWAETDHLLSSPENAARLFAALAEARRGKTKPMSVEEFRAALGL